MVGGRPAGPGRHPPSRSETAIYAERAWALGLPFSASVDLGAGQAIDPEVIRRGVIGFSLTPERRADLAPAREIIPDLRDWLARCESARSRIAITTPTALRLALMAAGAETAVVKAVERLARRSPEFSAACVITGRQALAGLGSLVVLALLITNWPGPAIAMIGLVLGLICLAVTCLRFVAAAHVGRRAAAPSSVLRQQAGAGADLPVYSVLVPIRDEADMVADLVAGLMRLDWPHDKLDIKMIVEADDTATLEALRLVLPGPPFELVVVPVHPPRTKPKALAYALPFARGEFVTIYDAEDRPHPGQLREAYERLRAGGEELACVQAPIVIDNEGDGAIARQFAVEYAALFDGLLPTLDARQLPMPLGGTSTHFRRSALERVGGWDPFNVTEDADLGIRLARFGYRTGTIALPTLEEAPVGLGTWMNQRTRWYKGWLQTWLVHMRHPLRLGRDLGLRQTVGFNLITTSLLISAIIHPIYLVAVILAVVDPGGVLSAAGPLETTLLAASLFNLVAAYLAMALLAGRSLALRGRNHLAVALVGLPAYWLLMSAAAYRAVWQLATRPFFWGKTPHPGRCGFIRAQCPLVSAMALIDAPGFGAPAVGPAGDAVGRRRERFGVARPLAWASEA